jgi:hypothetical protein
VAREDTLSYTVSVNGPAGDWYWQVICDRDIIARGLAPTMTKARSLFVRVLHMSGVIGGFACCSAAHLRVLRLSRALLWQAEGKAMRLDDRAPAQEIRLRSRH